MPSGSKKKRKKEKKKKEKEKEKKVRGSSSNKYPTKYLSGSRSGYGNTRHSALYLFTIVYIPHILFSSPVPTSDKIEFDNSCNLPNPPRILCIFPHSRYSVPLFYTCTEKQTYFLVAKLKKLTHPPHARPCSRAHPASTLPGDIIISNTYQSSPSHAQTGPTATTSTHLHRPHRPLLIAACQRPDLSTSARTHKGSNVPVYCIIFSTFPILSTHHHTYRARTVDNAALIKCVSPIRYRNLPAACSRISYPIAR